MLIIIFVLFAGKLFSQNLVIQDSVKLEVTQIYASSFDTDKSYHIIFDAIKKEVSVFNGSLKKIFDLKIKESNMPNSDEKNFISMLNTTTVTLLQNSKMIGFTSCVNYNLVFYFDYNMKFIKSETSKNFAYSIDEFYSFKKKIKSRKGYYEYSCILQNKGDNLKKLANLTIEKRHRDNNLIESLHWIRKDKDLFFLPMYKDSVIKYESQTNNVSIFSIQSSNFTISHRTTESGLAEKLFQSFNMCFELDTLNQYIYRIIVKSIPDSCNISNSDKDLTYLKKKFLLVYNFQLERLLEVEIPNHYLYSGYEKGILLLSSSKRTNQRVSCGPDFGNRILNCYKIPLSQWSL